MQFISLLEDVDAKHTDVPYDSNVQQLNLGKVLKRVGLLGCDHTKQVESCQVLTLRDSPFHRILICMNFFKNHSQRMSHEYGWTYLFISH
jgi:hypothetical protein